ncbi:hypothetical protein CC80DRAFT_274492 [Byssothecium circinans]|uniref:Uncharacterized protein n=1 Tax=Byssothecium circinans TaxID=147558 RepID=A0A6A5T9L0_9PLEO|nr:hypothetical protein CC80DRAFT_274492 [Byssothecium circinans]
MPLPAPCSPFCDVCRPTPQPTLRNRNCGLVGMLLWAAPGNKPLHPTCKSNAQPHSTPELHPSSRQRGRKRDIKGSFVKPGQGAFRVWHFCSEDVISASSAMRQLSARPIADPFRSMGALSTSYK